MKNKLINALLFGASTAGVFYFKNHLLISFSIASAYFIIQTALFAKFDRDSFLICMPLALYGLLLGLIQYKIIGYQTPSYLLIYPMFALTLNSSLKFLGNNLFVSFFLASALGIFLFETTSILFLSWGIYLVLLIVLNRKLIRLREKYTSPEEIKKPITAIFDNHCSFCSHEMEKLKNREQTGETIYACPSSPEDLSKITTAFSYDEAMKSIHALDSNGNVITGTLTISEVFARANLPLFAITLQAPGLSYLFALGYNIFTKLRKRSSC
jgi:predicted DCC family thiol-disulfide oxidoreductase YuxK